MQKDKKLDELLTQHAMEETGTDFTAGVMNKIAALQTSKHHITSLFQSSLSKILAGVFALICIALMFISFVAHPFEPGININILPASYTIQLIYFFAVFWSVMLVNLWWKKRNGVPA